MRIKIAGLCAEVSGETPEVAAMCREFITEEPASVGIGLFELSPFEQSIELLSKLNDLLIDLDTFLVHGSALMKDGRAVLFCAHSGTGKSTHAKMWRLAFGNEVTMINDDKPFLRVTQNGAFVCSSPWMGKHRLGTNIEAPLGALCFLERASTDRAVKITPKEALRYIFDQVPHPPRAEYMSRLLGLLDRLLTDTPLYRIEVTPTENAARTVHQTITGEWL